jgi:hypothetical protein
LRGIVLKEVADEGDMLVLDDKGEEDRSGHALDDIRDDDKRDNNDRRRGAADGRLVSPRDIGEGRGGVVEVDCVI